MSNVIGDPNFPVLVPGDALARSIRYRKPVVNQDTTLNRRQGVIAAVNLVNGVPTTVDLVLGDADVTVPGVQFLTSYSPFVGDLVWVDMKGADPCVIGSYLSRQWVTPGFAGAWVNFGGGHQVAQYRRESDNTVRIRGLIASGNFGVAAFTLGVGYRPPGRLVFVVTDGSGVNGGAGRLDINTDGTVVPIGYNAAFFSINVAFALD